MSKQILKYSASKLHKMGGELREEDKLEESMVYETLALVKFIENRDYRGVIDTLQARFLTWKHLFLLSKDSALLELAKKDAQASLSITKKFKFRDFYSKSYFRIGEVFMLEKKYKNAVTTFIKALSFYEGLLSEKGNFRYHLGEALYRSNNKEKGYKTMLDGLYEIEEGKGKTDSFLYNVWKTGCLMRMAELLRTDNAGKAIEYMKSTEDILKSDKRLIIRRRQFEELKNILKLNKLLFLS